MTVIVRLVKCLPTDEDFRNLTEHVYNHFEDYDEEDFEELLHDYESVYDSIRDELPELLTEVERKYKTHVQHHHDQELSPLLSLFAQEPHTMTIMMNPMKMEPKIKVYIAFKPFYGPTCNFISSL